MSEMMTLSRVWRPCSTSMVLTDARPSLTLMRVALLPGSGQALAFWSLQIALNTLWSPIFFGAHRMGLGFFIITFLWLAVAAVLISFWSLDIWAGALILPYLVWVTVAAALNFSVWRRNRTA